MLTVNNVHTVNNVVVVTDPNAAVGQTVNVIDGKTTPKEVQRFINPKQ
jgi:hypothetical protein